jgi:hypothetical protein
VDVKLKLDGSYVWEKIVKETTAAKAKPQVMVSFMYILTFFKKL